MIGLGFGNRWGNTAIRLLTGFLLALVFLTPAQANTERTGTISATTRVNIRSCASIDCQVIGSADLGDAVEVTGDPINGFVPVRWYEREGYVFSLYLTSDGEAPWFVEGASTCNRVALVFNIGIGDEPSQAILDTLIASGTPATMFPMGWWALEQPEFLGQIAAAGFPIGTHGDQPLFLTGQTEDTVRTDVTNSVTAIESVIGRELDPYFTPYAADTNSEVRQVVSDLGLLPVGWRVSGDDYGPEATEESVYNRVMNNVYPGSIVELHLDGPATANSTALALPRIIEDLQAQGYQLVTVPDLVIPCDGSTIGG